MKVLGTLLFYFLFIYFIYMNRRIIGNIIRNLAKLAQDTDDQKLKTEYPKILKKENRS